MKGLLYPNPMGVLPLKPLAVYTGETASPCGDPAWYGKAITSHWQRQGRRSARRWLHGYQGM